MRKTILDSRPLNQRLPHQSELKELQLAQAAVKELG
jgi:hypothetical protein